MAQSILSGVQGTLLIPLMSRARITTRLSSLLFDPDAVRIIEILSGPMRKIDNEDSLCVDLGNAARARNFDDIIKKFIGIHPNATIINLGAGFDTGFSRVDNGQITWHDIDLPDIIALRKVLIPETDRSICIAGSLFDPQWAENIQPKSNGLLITAGGVLPYFTATEIQQFFKMIIEKFPYSQFVFDTVSPFCSNLTNQKLKEVGIADTTMKWAVGKDIDFFKWDNRITFCDYFPMFSRIQRLTEYSRRIKQTMDEADAAWNMSIVHLKFN